MSELATQFGKSLDEDDFELTKSLLSQNCEYIMNDSVLNGPDEIVESYYSNMIEGRKKLDELIWGKSWVEQLNEDTFVIHFTDYLMHKGIGHVHRCEQRIQIKDQKIIQIVHINNLKEESSLKEFYLKVGLITE